MAYMTDQLTQPDRDMIDALRAVLGLRPLYAADLLRSEAERFYLPAVTFRPDNAPVRTA